MLVGLFISPCHIAFPEFTESLPNCHCPKTLIAFGQQSCRGWWPTLSQIWGTVPLPPSQEAQIPSLRPKSHPWGPIPSHEAQFPVFRAKSQPWNPNPSLGAQFWPWSRNSSFEAQNPAPTTLHYTSPKAQIQAPRPHYRPQGPNANCWKERGEENSSYVWKHRSSTPTGPLPYSLPQLQAQPT